MLVNDNEYGAPWNDQFYVVTYEFEEDVFTEVMVLSGPYKYSDRELINNAHINFGSVEILSIKGYHEVYR